MKPVFAFLNNILDQYNQIYNYCFTRKQLRNQFKQYPCSRPTWNGLPDVAVRNIFGQLKVGDRARFMTVSKSWKQMLCRDDLPIAPELWMICLLSDLNGMKHVKFTSTSESKTYSFKLPQFCKGICESWLCGSSGGWLIVASGPEFKQDLFLWNPLSGVIMTLPRLSIPPRLLKSSPQLHNNIKQVVVSQECVVAIVLSNPDDAEIDDDEDEKPNILAICTPKDTRWTILGKDNFYASDILFHDERLYGLAKHVVKDKYNNSTKSTTKICLSEYKVEVCILYPEFNVDEIHAQFDGNVHFDDDVDEDTSSNPMFNITYGDQISEHLVEFAGQLLIIAVFSDLYEYNSNGGPTKTFSCHKFQRIEVRKVDGMGKVENLDEGIIALTNTGSLTVPTSAIYPGVHDSGILFRIQGPGYVGDDDNDDEGYECIAHETGFLNLETQTLYGYNVKYFAEPTIYGWHTPKLL